MLVFPGSLLHQSNTRLLRAAHQGRDVQSHCDRVWGEGESRIHQKTGSYDGTRPGKHITVKSKVYSMRIWHVVRLKKSAGGEDLCSNSIFNLKFERGWRLSHENSSTRSCARTMRRWNEMTWQFIFEVQTSYLSSWKHWGLPHVE